MTFSSTTHHTFDIRLARKYGIEKALIIHHIQQWIIVNKFKGTNFKDGRFWTHQTKRNMAAIFPYFTVSKIRHHLEGLASCGILIIKEENEVLPDKDTTLWYAFVNEKEFGVDEDSINDIYGEDRILKFRGKNV